jgi:hypothetical protein
MIRMVVILVGVGREEGWWSLGLPGMEVELDYALVIVVVVVVVVVITVVVQCHCGIRRVRASIRSIQNVSPAPNAHH